MAFAHHTLITHLQIDLLGPNGVQKVMWRVGTGRLISFWGYEEKALMAGSSGVTINQILD